MPYRAREYVPDVYEPNDSRLNQLLLLQNQNEANRINQAGVANALMWRGVGQSAENMLSSLAQYKREAPQRAEEERKRKEADKLRGLQQQAGSFVDPVTGKKGMSQEAYGKLLQQEGFMDLGQGYLDKDAERKDKELERGDRQRIRDQQELSEIYNDLVQADPTTYDTVRSGIEKRLGPEKYKALNLPPKYDEPTVKGVAQNIGTRADEIQRNVLAKSAYELAAAKRGDEDYWQQAVEKQLALQLPLAGDAETWASTFANAKNKLKGSGLSEEVQKRILAGTPYPEQFSDAALVRARDLDPHRSKTTPTLQTIALKAWRDSHHGEDPKTPADIQAVQRAGTALTAGKVIDPLQLAKEKNDAEQELDLGVRYVEEHYDPNSADAKRMLEQIHETYQSKIQNLQLMGGGGYGYSAGYGGGAAPSSWGGGATGAPSGKATGLEGVGRVEPTADGRFKARHTNIPGVGIDFDTKQQAENYLLSVGSGQKGAAAAPAAPAAPPDYSDQLYGDAPPPPSRDYSDQYYGGGGGGSVAALAQPIKTVGDIPADIANWWNQPRPSWRKDPAGLPPPAPAAPPGPPPRSMGDQLGITKGLQQIQQAPMGTGAALPPGPEPPAGPPVVRIEPSRDANIPVTNGAVTGYASERDLQALQQQGFKPVEGGAAPSRQSAAPVPQGNLAQTAGRMRPPAAPPAAPPATPDPLGGKPEQIIEQAQVKVTEGMGMKARLEVVQALMNAAGYDVRPISTVRSAKEQADLYAKGRTAPGSIVTEKSGAPGDESRHQAGKAVDFAFYVGGKPVQSNDLPWHLLGLAARKAGLNWGGDWKSLVDRPHVELPEFVGPVAPGEQNFREPLQH